MMRRRDAVTYFSVDGLSVFVSGGSRGIGLAMARGFAEHGARVVVGSHDEAELEASGLDYEVCDVRDAEQIDGTIAAVVERHGRLDVVLNVAGRGLPLRGRADADRPPRRHPGHRRARLPATWRARPGR